MNKAVICSNCGASFVPERIDKDKNKYCNQCYRDLKLETVLSSFQLYINKKEVKKNGKSKSK